MIISLQIILLALEFLLAIAVGYLLVLTVAAKRAEIKSTPIANNPTHRFLILIPAHNEERLISATLANLEKLDYPTHLFSVHVVADNCTDQTAGKVRECGVDARERFDENRRGKGYALQWLLEILWSEEILHDAVVIIDADSILSENFLRVMDVRLSHGERAIQAYYSVRNPGSSSAGSLRYAALAAIHFLRPQGRMVLGGSVGLKGNGMVFVNDLIRNMYWSASITEDIDQHMALIMNDERVTFAPDAIVWGEMPDTLTNSESQIARWESGRLQMARQYVMPLLKRAWEEHGKGNHARSFVLFDAAMEHLILPFSVLFGLSFGLLWIDLFFAFLPKALAEVEPNWLFASNNVLTGILLILSLGLLTGQLIYLLAGLRMVKAPRFIYLSLLNAPVFVVWKIVHYIGVLFGRSQKGWVRTHRNEG
jgi:1,2-diacylglycerol 3-beta-glucosyltransferase